MLYPFIIVEYQIKLYYQTIISSSFESALPWTAYSTSISSSISRIYLHRNRVLDLEVEEHLCALRLIIKQCAFQGCNLHQLSVALKLWKVVFLVPSIFCVFIKFFRSYCIQ